MSWMKHVMCEVANMGLIYIDEPTIDMWVLQHEWDFPVRYVAVQTATGRVCVPTITPKTAWRLLNAARHHDGKLGHALASARRFLEDALEALDYPATLPEFYLASSWDEAKLAPSPAPLGPGGGKTGLLWGAIRG